MIFELVGVVVAAAVAKVVVAHILHRPGPAWNSYELLTDAQIEREPF